VVSIRREAAASPGSAYGEHFGRLADGVRGAPGEEALSDLTRSRILRACRSGRGLPLLIGSKSRSCSSSCSACRPTLTGLLASASAIGESLVAPRSARLRRHLHGSPDNRRRLTEIVFKIKEDYARNPGVPSPTDCRATTHATRRSRRRGGAVFETYGFTGVALITFHHASAVNGIQRQVQLLLWILRHAAS